MTDITILTEALEAAAITLHARWVIMQVQDGGDPLDYERWEGLEEKERRRWRSEARAAGLAMLRAWPGMKHDPGALVTDTYRDPGKIILPLPNEKETSA